MKTTYNILLFALLALLPLISCSHDDNRTKGDKAGGAMTLAVAQDPREVGNDFFKPGDIIGVTVTSDNANDEDGYYDYTYTNEGYFRGNPGYRFTLDDNYILSTTAVWPRAAERPTEVSLDQRLEEDFKAADWMNATASVQGVMPTDTPVPLNFVRENAMLEFQVVGQNTEGLDIDTLAIALTINGVSRACWAYCGDPNGNAYLILNGGSRLVAEEGELIGVLTVTNEDKYFIILPETDLLLEDGKRYLVTLTPQGYDMTAFIFIGGWSQSEDGIGIPFQQPTPDMDGNFLIETPLQLITMSYLIRHYNHPETFDWRTRTYVISDDFVMTDEFADQYIPVPRSLFDGRIIRDNADIETIEYGSGDILELYQ